MNKARGSGRSGKALKNLTTIGPHAPSIIPNMASGLPTRVLGRTGVNVSILCLGGWHIGAASQKDESEAIRIMHTAIDDGLTFFDNAWDYLDGVSENVMGKALAMDGKRSKVFLMTKNCNRDYDGSMKCLEESLKRLQTDYIDLWQFHECNWDNDPEWIFEKGGIRAAVEARKSGKVRFIGFTGHKDPRIHRMMLDRDFEWDTVQMPINVMDGVYRSFQNQILPTCLERNIGVIGMKGFGGGYPHGRFLKDVGLSVEECLRYALSVPVATQVVGINSMDHLRQDIAVARDFVPMSKAEMKEFETKVRDEAGDGRHELFKSTIDFDGPHHRKQHGFALGA